MRKYNLYQDGICIHRGADDLSLQLLEAEGHSVESRELKLFKLWYNNGTGYYGGPYPVEAESMDEAIDKSRLRWCVNMYGKEAVLNYELDPNIIGQWNHISASNYQGEKNVS